MANREYNMQFLLDARLNSNYNSAFTAAQKKFQELHKEVQSLSRVQSDISSYQKQQQSIAKTNERLESYKKQLEITQKELAQSGNSNSELAYREETLKQKIKDTQAALESKSQSLQKLGEKLSGAGVNINDLTGETKRLEEEMTALRKKEEDAGKEAEQFSQKGVSAFEAVGSALVAAGIATGLKKISDAYKECMTESMEFGSTMSTVEALSGASSAEMQELTATAKEMGATTVFTANQSAQAMTYMGMAGWKAGQMMSGMDGVINLAAASGEDLATVSDIVTDNLTAFGLKAEDTAHFADVLAAAATNSNTSVGIMGETFKGSASVAGALGYSIEDVAVGVGLMANAGVKGSIANTALKNTFNGLLGGVTLTGKAFGEAEYTAVNADGTMKSFGDTIQELRGYFEQMTESERVNNAMALAGQRGYNGLLAILNATDEDYQKLSDSINNCSGAAQRMANIKLDNLKGDVTLLDSATSALKMTVGGLYEKELRGAAQIGAEIINKINEFCEKNPIIVKSIMAITAEVGGFLVVYNAVNAAKKIKNTLSALSTTALAAETVATNAQTTAQIGLNAAMDANPIGVVIGLVGALTVGITALVELENQHNEQIENSLMPASQKQANELERLNALYDTACKEHDELTEQDLRLKGQIDDLTASFESEKQTVGEFYDACNELIVQTDELINSYQTVTSEAASEEQSTMALIQRLQDLSNISNKTAAEENAMRAVFNKIKQDLPDLNMEFEDLAQNSESFVQSMKEAAKQKADAKKYEESLNVYADQIAQQEEYKKGIEDAKSLQDSYFMERSYNSFGGYSDIDAARNAALEAQELQAKLDEVERQMTDIQNEWGVMASEAEESAQKEVSAYEGVETALGNVKEHTETLVTAYNEAYQAAFDSVNGQYALWDEAAEVSAKSVSDVNANLEGQKEYWENYNSNLEILLEKSKHIEGLRDLIASFSDGSPESVNMIAGLASSDTTDEEIKEMVANWDELKEQQQKVAESLADVKTDFETQMSGIEEIVSDTIENMNMSDEAKEAALETIKSYSAGIMAGLGSVEDAATLVKNTADAALNGLPVPEVPSYTDFTMSQTAYGPQMIDFNSIPGFATGTQNAPSGYAIVGENGPEIVRFGGGEQVYTTNETKAILGDFGGSRQSPVTITISPSFTVNGSMDEQSLEEISDKLVELIQNTLRDNDIDIRRCAYV